MRQLRTQGDSAKLLAVGAAKLSFAVAGRAIAADVAGSPRTLFTNVHGFDGEKERRIENAHVLLEGNLIK